MEQEYYAHYRKDDGKYQLLKTHNLNTAVLSENYCSIKLLKKCAWLAGFYHDGGKGADNWREYFYRAIHDENEKRGEKIDHSTLGGLVAADRMPDSIVGEMIEAAIYNHHGIADGISVKDGSAQILNRRKKYTQNQVQALKVQLENYAEGINLEEQWENARIDFNELKELIIALSRKGEKAGQYGNKQFFLGMCERMLFSCLMDGDFRDTADFMNHQETTKGFREEQLQEIWEQGVINLEEKIQKFEQNSRIDICRTEISKQCKDAAIYSNKLYRLSVPTGAGKTLASLRFAVHCAKEQKKRHIFYVGPFKSIIEQNAGVIRSALGMEDIVLEHHGDVVYENEEQMKYYDRLTENWDEVPVIVTTAVQFFNTLFKEKKRNIRRFHSLSNSVVILDEVQAFPIKVIQLFNLAANFLTEICNTTMVLCTATQPLFDRVKDNRLLPPMDMVTIPMGFEDVFQRVEFMDYTEMFGGKASGEQITEFILEKEEIHGQVLVIVNTKTCAETLYQMLKDRTNGHIFHLSTKMCAEHRSNVLADIRNVLKQEENLICISTQLVEAGIDFSFRCVIRSLAGLDNLIQAAGRCNRDGKLEKGYVYLVHLSSELEDISKIRDIKKAQEAMRQLLIKYRQNREAFDSRIDSEKAIHCYYQYYFYARQNEMNYGVKVGGVSTNLVDLFSENRTFRGKVKQVYLKQAFSSAGKAFQVIDETEGIDVVVPYGKSCNLLNKLKETGEIWERKQILRELQRYTVHLSNGWIRKLENAVYSIEENRIYILADGYYHPDTGVTEHPVTMPFLCS